MNVPFSQPNLSRYIQEGSDAAVSKVTFPDGTSQTTAASGGGAFTPVVYTGKWTSDFAVAYGTKIIPDSVLIEEGMDANYGMSSTRTAGYASFLVSEAMAGVYQLNICFRAGKGNSNAFKGPDISIKLDGEAIGDPSKNPGTSGIMLDSNKIVPFTQVFTTRLPAEAQLLIRGFEEVIIKEHGTMSIVKLSD